MRSLHALCGLTAVALLGACATVAGAAPAPHGPRTEKWIDLQVGECVADLPPADLSRVTVTVLDCATTHLAEVYLRAPMAVDTAIANVANRDCAAGFAPYTGQSVGSSAFSITYLIDSNQHPDLSAASRQWPTSHRLSPSLTPSSRVVLRGRQSRTR